MRPDQSLTEIINEASKTGVQASFDYNGTTYIFSPEGLLEFINENITLTPITSVTTLTVTEGGLQINDIPTADPSIAGVVYSDTGTLKISNGV